jgi:hypothetical protein
MKAIICIVVATIALTVLSSYKPTATSPAYEDLMYVGCFKSIDGNEPVLVEVFADKRDSSHAIYGSFKRYYGEKKLFIATGKCIYQEKSRSVAGFVMVADVTHGYSGTLMYP